MAKILVVDDNPAIVELVRINLEMQTHTVFTANDGIQGFAIAQQEKPHLIILDLMMPNVDGYTVCQRIRKQDSIANVPILMLTALGDIDDKLKGFDSGADDYLTKPFEIPELLVRVRALLRRTEAALTTSATKELLAVGHFTLMPDSLEAKVQESVVKLTPTEFEILNALIQNHGQTISLGKLLQDVWGYAPDDDVETLRVHIRHLRVKLEKSSPDVKYIETIYGGGYRLWPEGKTN
jgi:two-component system, OmpR family, response regulator RpaA